jgi:hypothetical protein
MTRGAGALRRVCSVLGAPSGGRWPARRTRLEYRVRGEARGALCRGVGLKGRVSKGPRAAGKGGRRLEHDVGIFRAG